MTKTIHGKKKRFRILLLSVIPLLLLAFLVPGFFNSLKVVRYDIHADGFDHPVRIAFVTDLHSCAYGDGQRELLDAIDAQRPDIVLLGGDIFDHRLPEDNANAFLEQIGSRYPCYAVNGNHEYLSGAAAFRRRMEKLEACGVKRLSGETVTLEINGETLRISGLDDPFAWQNDRSFIEHSEGSFFRQLEDTAASADGGAFNVLLTHRPEYLDDYAQYAYDLVLSGHAHGGQWRIPGIINGLWAPNQGLFPAYAGGRYDSGALTMIVSRGLARESTWLPRFYNRPELVIIELSEDNGM